MLDERRRNGADIPASKQAWLLVNRYIGAWPPSEMAAMPLSKLYEWYDLARSLWEQEQAELAQQKTEQ